MSKAHVIMVGGVALIPHLTGAIYIPSHKTLVIADLHLEQGSSLARRGLHVPPFDTEISLGLLETTLAEIKPDCLVFLGDSFHDLEGDSRLAKLHIERIRTITQNHETFWICGNHDPEPPQNLGGHAATEIALGPITLRHEPSTNLEGRFEIAGHLHPGCAVHQRGRRLYGKCFISDDARLIMPAFGAYTGGLNISSDAFQGLFNKKAAQALMIGRAALHRFPAVKLNLS